jgi:hypothetical protein
MSRDPLHTVTLPIVVAVRDSEKADGWLASFAANSFRTSAVKALDSGKVVKSYRRVLSVEARSVFEGLLELRTAYEGRNERALLEAIDKTQPWFPTIPGTTLRSDWTGEKIWGGARWHYSTVMNRALQKAELVMWWRHDDDRLLRPGVHCPDWQTAVFAAAFAGTVRVCPKCKTVFAPKTENQGYCTTAHGVAYRTARSRAKLRAAKGEAPKARSHSKRGESNQKSQLSGIFFE